MSVPLILVMWQKHSAERRRARGGPGQMPAFFLKRSATQSNARRRAPSPENGSDGDSWTADGNGCGLWARPAKCGIRFVWSINRRRLRAAGQLHPLSEPPKLRTPTTGSTDVPFTIRALVFAHQEWAPAYELQSRIENRSNGDRSHRRSNHWLGLARALGRFKCPRRRAAARSGCRPVAAALHRTGRCEGDERIRWMWQRTAPMSKRDMRCIPRSAKSAMPTTAAARARSAAQPISPAAGFAQRRCAADERCGIVLPPQERYSATPGMPAWTLPDQSSGS